MTKPPLIPDSRPRPSDPLPDDVVEQLLSGVVAEVFPASGGPPRARWSDLPGSRRLALAGGVAVALAATDVAMMGLRPDWAEVWPAFASLAAVLVLAAAWAMSAAWRPMWRRPASAASAATMVMLPTVIALLPWPGMHTADGAPWMQHVMCGAMGSALGFVVTLPMLALSRQRPGLREAALVAGAGGCTGFVAQNLICPLADVGHLVFAHGVAASALFVALAAGLAMWPARRRA